MQTDYCGHFSAEVELVSVQHSPVVLRVPVRRCALAERMIAAISRTDAGREVAEKIQILGSHHSGDAGSQVVEDNIRAAFGPDLEPISRPECSVARCQQSCTPGYKQVLVHFGYAVEAEEETGSGCLEIA